MGVSPEVVFAARMAASAGGSQGTPCWGGGGGGVVAAAAAANGTPPPPPPSCTNLQVSSAVISSGPLASPAGNGTESSVSLGFDRSKRQCPRETLGSAAFGHHPRHLPWGSPAAATLLNPLMGSDRASGKPLRGSCRVGVPCMWLDRSHEAGTLHAS